MTDERREKIVRLANQIVKRYGTRDPYELADWLNILVDFAPHPRLLGFSVIVFSKKVIGLNSRADANTRRCACAHELAHLVLAHHQDAQFQTNHLLNFSLREQRFEAEANVFAATLLLADAEMDEAIQIYPNAQSAAASLYVCAELFCAKLEILNAEGCHYRIPNATLRSWDGYVQ
ncbi:MAG: ImmA/IrrE family metallo-endopeptidase [Clostridia bacterium]